MSDKNMGNTGSTAVAALPSPSDKVGPSSSDIFAEWDLYSGATLTRSTIEELIPEASQIGYTQGSTIINSAIYAQLTPVVTSSGPSNSVMRIISRLRQLRNLSAGRSGGAAPPVKISVDNAISFVARAGMPIPPIATLDDEGIAVIEMESADMDFFADISFAEDGSIEVYRREKGKPSAICSGLLTEPNVEHFLRDELGVLI